MNEKTEEYYDRRATEMLSKIKPGTKLKIYYNKNNRNNKTYHVLGIFDDIQIAVKYYINFRWYYKFEDVWWFVMSEDNKTLTII